MGRGRGGNRSGRVRVREGAGLYSGEGALLLSQARPPIACAPPAAQPSSVPPHPLGSPPAHSGSSYPHSRLVCLIAPQGGWAVILILYPQKLCFREVK